MKNLITRTVTGAIFVALIVVSFFINPLFFHLLFLTFSLIATWEYLQMVTKTDTIPQIILPLVLTALLFSAFQLMHYSIYTSLVLLLITLVLILGVPIVELFRKHSQPLHNVALSLFPLIWITLPIGIIGMWAHFFEASSVVLALFIIIWASDSFAYCAGSLWGKHHLCERISPKKSWEGALISMLLTVGGAVLLSYIPYFQSSVFTTPWHWTGFALTVIIFGTFGDLIESMFKRNSGIKDSGNLLPGHGGILDRLDSMLLATPAGFIYWIICCL